MTRLDDESCTNYPKVRCTVDFVSVEYSYVAIAFCIGRIFVVAIASYQIETGFRRSHFLSLEYFQWRSLANTKSD